MSTPTECEKIIDKTFDTNCPKVINPLFITNSIQISCNVLDFFKTRNLTMEKLEALKKEIKNIIYPWDDLYNTVRLNFNKRFSVFPAMFVFACSINDISKTLNFAKSHKIPIAIRSGGHCFEDFSLTTGSVG